MEAFNFSNKYGNLLAKHSRHRRGEGNRSCGGLRRVAAGVQDFGMARMPKKDLILML